MESIFIKNMVCNRCIVVVRQEFEKLGLTPVRVTLGEAIIEQPLSKDSVQQIDVALLRNGFERIDDRKSRLIELIKKKVIGLIHHSDSLSRAVNWSSILSEELHLDYNYLSSLFSSVEGITLEQFIIHQKIEKVKELLFYDELNLTQIADKLGYSSVAHLSAQFKKITGFTPTELKKTRTLNDSRRSIDEV